MKRFARRAVITVILAAAASVGFSRAAFAQYGYYDDYYDRGSAQQAHNYGFQSGYHDGVRKGRHEGRENDPGDINVSFARGYPRLPPLDGTCRSFSGWV